MSDEASQERKEMRAALVALVEQIDRSAADETEVRFYRDWALRLAALLLKVQLCNHAARQPARVQ